MLSAEPQSVYHGENLWLLPRMRWLGGGFLARRAAQFSLAALSGGNQLHRHLGHLPHRCHPGRCLHRQHRCQQPHPFAHPQHLAHHPVGVGPRQPLASWRGVVAGTGGSALHSRCAGAGSLFGQGGQFCYAAVRQLRRQSGGQNGC